MQSIVATRMIALRFWKSCVVRKQRNCYGNLIFNIKNLFLCLFGHLTLLI